MQHKSWYLVKAEKKYLLKFISYVLAFQLDEVTGSIVLSEEKKKIKANRKKQVSFSFKRNDLSSIFLHLDPLINHQPCQKPNPDSSS